MSEDVLTFSKFKDSKCRDRITEFQFHKTFLFQHWPETMNILFQNAAHHRLWCRWARSRSIHRIQLQTLIGTVIHIRVGI